MNCLLLLLSVLMQGKIDLDIILVVDEPMHFILKDDWLKKIGSFNISFTEDSFSGGKARRILFDNALDVDFIFICKKSFDLEDVDITMMLERGYHILVDKIGIESIISKSNTSKKKRDILTELEFINIVNDFWYHAVWTVKKLKRGELWVAKNCVDYYMKQKLLSIIEYHAQVINGIEYDKWYSGRFIEEWADKKIIEELSSCFSHYNKEDIKVALLSTMNLFRLLAVKIAEKHHLSYPKSADNFATAYVIDIL